MEKNDLKALLVTADVEQLMHVIRGRRVMDLNSPTAIAGPQER